MRHYIALIHKDPRSDYGVSFPDLPGCVSAGESLEEARVMAEEALALHLDGLREDGETAPAPSTLEAIMADRENRKAVAFAIPFEDEAPKVVRINISVPEGALKRIDRYAEQQGFTRSGFLLNAAKERMRDSGEKRSAKKRKRSGAK